jgi:hypothetical protein
MRRTALLIPLFVTYGGCAGLIGIDPVRYRLPVRVHGLWDGVDGVALRLQADGVDTLLTVPTNGRFSFDQPLAPGTSYTVTVATTAVKHTCTVEAAGNGVIREGEVTDVSVKCTGPAFTLTFSGGWGWTFDPTEETQTFAGSIATQGVALTIGGSNLTGAKLNDAAAVLGQPTAPIALPLGETAATVAVTANELSKTYQVVFERGTAALGQVVYGKASNTGTSDQFGSFVALSGNTLVVSAPDEDSAAIGINSNQSDNSAVDSGAVYVFVRNGTTWSQQAYIKASNTGANDHFGSSVALYEDTLAVGAMDEASAATGINNNQSDNSAPYAGAVYVFIRSGTTWTQQAYIKASNTAVSSQFGRSVALSGDTLAVGAWFESSVVSGSGGVYVFVRSGSTWTQQALLKASNPEYPDVFGCAVALSGNTLAVGAFQESSAATGINSNDRGNAALYSGAAYVFVRSGTTWTEQAYIKASNTDAGDHFGNSIALSGDTLAVGADNEHSAAPGIDGSQLDNTMPNAGAAYVFTRSGTTWTQQAYIKASNPGAQFFFGRSIALFGDTLAVGANNEASATTGIDSTPDKNASSAGAAYVFVRTGTAWAQKAYVKASNTGANDKFGESVALSQDTLATGALHEASNAVGINPANGQTNNAAVEAGAVYVFR